MSAQDPYYIQGVDPPKPTQPAEHPTVETRAKKALVVAASAVFVALISALFSFLQWKAADRQVDVTDRAFKLDQRAWIGITFPTHPTSDIRQKDGDVFMVPIAITNTGRTPARKVEVNANCTILRASNDALDLNSSGPIHRSRLRFELVQPSEVVNKWGIPALDVDSGTSVPAILTSELRKHIADGGYTVVVHGKITYVDYSGREHWVRFCHYANGLIGGTEQCFNYNDFDRDDQK